MICALVSMLAACHAASKPPDAFGGESHFLAGCGPKIPCEGGLECVGGLCTLTCDVDARAAEAACGMLHPDATCESGLDPALPACDLACALEADCPDGTGRCQDGFCRVPNVGPNGAASICTDEGCPAGGAPVTECGSIGPALPQGVTVDDAHIEGDLLYLTVQHGGGCERDEFTLCRTNFETASPVGIQLRLEHAVVGDGGDTCHATEVSELTFDLTSVADWYRVWHAEAGVVSTPFGFYTIGEPECIDRQATATQALNAVQRELPNGCEDDADCVQVSDETLCSSGCGALIAVADMEVWASVIGQVSEQVCGPDALEQGCVPVPQPCPPPNGAPGCVDGRCRLVEP